MAKKKTQIKKVARPFATASTPKKALPDPDPNDEIPVEEVEAPEAAVNGVNGSPSNGIDHAVQDEFDPAAMEEVELQTLAEKVKPQAHREITRLIKVYCSAYLLSSIAYPSV